MNLGRLKHSLKISLAAKVFLFFIATGFTFASIAATSYTDLTAKMYKGSDADLAGFNLIKFGVNCEEAGNYSPGDVAYISWENHTIKEETKNNHKQAFRADEYSIHFRVKDRRGEILTEEAFKFDSKIHRKQGYVIHDPSSNQCDRDAVKFSKKIDLSFATVEYWVTQIKWEKYTPNFGIGSNNSDKIAFSVTEKQSDSNAVEAEKNRGLMKGTNGKPIHGTDMKLSPTFIEPKDNQIKTFQVEPNLKGFLFLKKTYLGVFKTDEKWKNQLIEFCKITNDCDNKENEIIKEADDGSNLKNYESEQSCSTSGCLGVIARWNSSEGCSSVWKKIKLEACTGEEGLFSSERCQIVSTHCAVIEPKSYRATLADNSERLFIFRWDTSGFDYLKLTVGDTKEKIPLK